MITDLSNIPVNSETPLSDAEVYAMEYEAARVGQAALIARAAAHCTVNPSTLPTPSLVAQALTAQQAAAQGLIYNTAAFQQQVNQQSGQGTTIDPSAISDAPEVIPYAILPSAAARPTPRRRTPQRRVMQPGTGWGSPAAASVPGPCVIQPQSLREKLASNPWGALLLYLGLGAAVYAAVKK